MCIYVCVYVCVCMCVCVYVCMHVCIKRTTTQYNTIQHLSELYIYIYIYISYTHTLYMCIYIYTYIFTHKYIYTHICILLHYHLLSASTRGGLGEPKVARGARPPSLTIIVLIILNYDTHIYNKGSTRHSGSPSEPPWPRGRGLAGRGFIHLRSAQVRAYDDRA